MVTIYTKAEGRPVRFAHMIDAKESVANGYYVWNAPPKKQELPEKSEAKPAVIPTVADKKPVVEKTAEPVKPIKRGIIRKPSKITK